MLRSNLIFLFSMLVASAAGAEELREISGSAIYRDRKALPPDASLTVEATGFQDIYLATIDLDANDQ